MSIIAEVEYDGRKYYLNNSGTWTDKNHICVPNLENKLNKIYRHEDFERDLVFPAKTKDKPEDYYATGKLKINDKEYGFFILVENKKEQDLTRGIIFYDTELAKKILYAYLYNDKIKEFSFGNNKYVIVSSSVLFRHKESKKALTHFCGDLKEIKRIFVYEATNFVRSQNDLISVKVFVFCRNHSEPVPMNVYYSIKQGYYFISKTSFRVYNEEYGLIAAIPVLFEKNSVEFSCSEMREESILKFYNYDVSAAHNYSEKERQDKLARLIDYKIISKYDTINYLEYFIKLREYDMEKYGNAIEKWKSDLLFLNNYEADFEWTQWADKDSFTQVIRRDDIKWFT